MSRVPALLIVMLVVGTAPSGASESVRSLPGSISEMQRRSVVVGQVTDDVALPYLTVFLGVRRRAALEALIAAQQDARSPHFRRWLDDEELADRFGPTRAEYERVRRWLIAQGFEVRDDSPFRLAIVVAGSAGTVRRALGSPIVRLRRGGRLYRGPATDPALPVEIAASVRGIFGLDDLPRFRPLARLVNGTTALAPADFASVYEVTPLRTTGLSGAGQSVAVLARSNFSDRDVARFGQRFLTEPVTTPQRVLVGADPGISRDLAEEIEVLIDTQWAGALAPAARVNVVISPPDGDIPEALAHAVYTRAGDVISISFGLCEAATPALLTELFDAFYAFANAKGQTIVVAAGDSGGTECAPADRRRAGVNLLASSPHAVAVGGTSFPLAGDGTPVLPVMETVWNDAYGAGGGGESEVFARPRYQRVVGLPESARRILPDLALAGSPATPGYAIVAGGQERAIGGTSAAAPAFASVLALASERLGAVAGGSGLGQLVPQLYRLGSEQVRGLRAEVFRDVTVGTNALPGGVGFAATPGYDRASGWGAPRAAALLAALEGPGRCEPLYSCLVPRAGRRRHACHAEWLVEHEALATRRGLPLARQSCRDGDPACDVDGQIDGTCTINVALCTNVFDARPALLGRGGLPRCEATWIRRVNILPPLETDPVPGARDNWRTLRRAVATLPVPGTLRDACTATVPIVIPAVGDRASSGTVLRARVVTRTARRNTRLVLRCLTA